METKVLVLSRMKVEESFRANGEKCALISIISPEAPPVNDKGQFVDVLRLEFYDIISPTKILGEGYCEPMTEKQADEVVAFVKKWWGKVSLLVVHCEAGISRSSGTAGAILKYMTGDDKQIFKNPMYYPNPTCYSRVLDSFAKNKDKAITI